MQILAWEVLMYEKVFHALGQIVCGQRERRAVGLGRGPDFGGVRSAALRTGFVVRAAAFRGRAVRPRR